MPKAADMLRVMESLWVTALVWSFGVVTDARGQRAFSEFLMKLVCGKLTSPESDPAWANFLIKNPGQASDVGRAVLDAPPVDQQAGQRVHDWVFDVSTLKWQSWQRRLPRYQIPDGASFSSILVPTVDTVRVSWVMDQLLARGRHVLVTGDTGTGKSVGIINKLLNELDKSRYQPMFINFSAQTSENQTQDVIDARLVKRRKGYYGPPLGMRCVVFVDDLNMPAKEAYGAQPPIELLRQWMDHGGWYDRKENSFRNLVDLQFVAAMGPPGGGRTRITQRYVRHFNMLGLVPFDASSLTLIFGTIVEWHLQRFPAAVRAAGAPLVEAAIGMYNTISEVLLPTPAKSHYTFNLRDLSKVVQGVLRGRVERVREPLQLARLWAHECTRVFHDRLINEEDRRWFFQQLAQRVQRHFGAGWAEVRGPHETLLYGNFLEGGENPAYDELADRERLRGAMATFLEDYNNVSGKPMQLVLFMNAVEHVARISRVVTQPRGHALLVGVGGSGRQSLTRLATFMADYQLYQVEISKAYGKSEWHDDIKVMMRKAGVEGRQLVFLFTDTQIVRETFVEDVSNLLNTGEVPNLFDAQELSELLEGPLRAKAAAAGVGGSAAELYSFFVERCRANLHVVLCFSPIGDAFRRRLRMFPSLVNCCTINWFTDWPDEALRGVADHFLHDVAIAPEVRQGVVDVCVSMQERVARLAVQYREELRRYYYVTPTSYLELIGTFKALISQKRQQVSQSKSRYDNGLQKLRSTADMVADMQEDLKALQPKLRVAAKETEATLAKIDVMSVQANQKRDVVAAEADMCSRQAADAQALKEECEAKLSEAIPALESAIRALNSLTKPQLVEVKSMKKPPDGVKLTLEAVCIMMGVEPIKVPHPSGRGKMDSYWEPAQKELLGDPKLLERLSGYDKDNMKPAVIAKVLPYRDLPDFQPGVIEKASVAAGGLCKWVHAMIKYDEVAKVVAPKRAALKEATATLESAETALRGKRAELQEVEDQLAELQRQLQDNMSRKQKLQNDVDDCTKRLDRAQRLIGGLGGERDRWTQASQQLQLVYDNVVGDILLSSGLIAYLGAFTSKYREECVAEWSALLRSKRIPCAEAFSLEATLGDPVQIRAWTIARLPNDAFSISNAIMLSKSNRWPLMIDPQGQANQWVRHTEANLRIVRQSQSTFVRTVENAIQFGIPVLLENVGESLDPVLEPVLLKQVVKQGGVLSIRVGDNTVSYDDKFRLYMTTKLRNPHYPPEVCVRVNLLNFMATKDGLEDQMLGIVVRREEQELEARREKLVLEDAENKRQLKELESRILMLLEQSKGNILDDEELISTLSQAKDTSSQIMRQVEVAAKTQREIENTRQRYKPVAKRASLLFFCIADLAGVDPMYQYSLGWFIALFERAIGEAPRGDTLDDRLGKLNETFTYVLYRNVCRSLFEKDKLLFSFLLCAKVLQGDARLDAAQLNFFLQGSTVMEAERPNPARHREQPWLSDLSWRNFLGLARLPGFEGVAQHVEQHLDAWEAVFGSADPLAAVTAMFGEQRYDAFARLLLLRCVRLDKVLPALQGFVAAQLGAKYIDPPTFDLQGSYADSTCSAPLVFVLSPGADPMTELQRLAERTGFDRKMFGVSLGQGQGPKAEDYISEGVDKGTWVVLQNCHLAESWMPTLEKLCEEITPERAHPEFRLWLTSMPSDKFPVSILQNGVKITIEPPKGMRANLLGSYSAMDAKWLDECSNPDALRKLAFGLCFFHALVRERRKFAALGWNIPYDFSDPDLRISLDQLRVFLDTYEAVPYRMLSYLTGECNYGGRVTDDKDRRCLMGMLADFVTPDILSDAYRFSPSGVYYAPPSGDLASYVAYIRALPFIEGPEVFGLHDNADITSAISEANVLLATALSLQPRAAGGAGTSWEETLGAVARDIAGKVPEPFDIEKVEVLYPVRFEESMNTVLTQELIRFNRLLVELRQSVVDVQRAIKGEVVMSAELEQMGNSMVKGLVPAKWKAVAYPSLKPLGAWIADLLARLTFFQSWIDHGPPDVYWISGFFFTQSFLTGTRQNFARKYTIPIDEVTWDFRVLTPAESDAIAARAPDGCYVRGLFLDGCAWDADRMVLGESRPRELFCPVPSIWLVPRETAKMETTRHVYECPTYKTSERRGTLSTTGHSTNFVMMVMLPMAKEHTERHWVKRGVALLTQLDD